MIKITKKNTYGLLYILLFSTAIFFCIRSERLQENTTEILTVCARSVVPSLFPFMVISSLLTQSAPYLFSESKTLLPVLKLPSCSLIAVILGALCGFPTGVVTVAGLKKRGLISKSQAEKLAMVSNNAGPAFIIEVVGAAFWGSRAIGIKLYLFQLISCAILGLICFSFLPNLRHDEKAEALPTKELPKNDIASLFCEAVASSSIGIIKICGYIVFFSVAVESLSIILPDMSPTIRAFISSFLEFTSGCRLSAAVGSKTALAISAFSIGFSGLSVMAQGASFASKADFSLKKTMIFKLFQGALCALLAYFLI